MTIQKQYTVSEVAEMLKLDKGTVRRWIKAAKLKAIPIPGRGRGGQEWRIPQSEIEKFGFEFMDNGAEK